MTVQTTDEDLVAAFAHALTDRARECNKWEAQAKEWKTLADIQRDELTTARATLQRVRAERDRYAQGIFNAANDYSALERQHAELEQQLLVVTEQLGILRDVARATCEGAMWAGPGQSLVTDAALRRLQEVAG